MTADAEWSGVDERAVVLVVDDTTASRYITSSWLKRSGHQVIEASTGEEALRTLATQAVDLVILDVGLPDMSGFEVCELIKADPGSARPVIHLSATSVRGADRAQGLTRGADAYLVEPVEPDELLATVASVLRYYRARDVAERFADQLSRLTAATMAMQKATAFDQLTAAIACGAAEVFGVAAVAMLASPEGSVQRAVAGGGLSAPVLDSIEPTVLADIATSAGGARRTVPFPLSARLLAGTGNDKGSDWTAVLLAARGTRTPGVVAVREPLARPDQVELLAQIGQAAMLAFDSLRLYTEEHNLALTLQRSFLPSRLPRRRGLEVAARYVPAADNAEIGGDFYELIELDDGRLLIAVGDVAGHSIHAATVMVELRHALRAYALEGHRPSVILDCLELMLRQYHPLEFATLCVLLLNEERNELTIANAGHLRPLLLENGKSSYLEVDGPMLGLRRPHPPDRVHALAADWLLVLITDGLVEDPQVDLDVALEDLRSTAMDELDPDRLCERLLERFGRPRFDDIALLVLRGTPSP